MAQENVEIVAEAIAALNRRDLDATLSHMADDITWAPFLAAIDTPLIVGKQQVRKHWETQIELLDLSWEAEEVTDLGNDTVLATVRIAGRGASGGVPVEARPTMIAVLRDRRVVSVQSYSSRSEALEAAGLSE